VKLEGDKSLFVQKSDSGQDKHSSFCATCGTTIYWELDAIPNVCAVAVGAFADQDLGEPSQSWFERSAHHWVQLPDAISRHETQ
jgi:hypothetical protein